MALTQPTPNVHALSSFTEAGTLNEAQARVGDEVLGEGACVGIVAPVDDTCYAFARGKGRGAYGMT